jgi:amino acid permease
LYLKAREACPNRPSSLFEIGFLTIGRPAIFAICFMVWISSFFLIAIFINVFSNTAKQVTVNFAGGEDQLPVIFQSNIIYGLAIAILLFPTCFMKEIAELHWVSMSLFGAALSFVAILTIQIILRGYDATNPSNTAAVPPLTLPENIPTINHDFWSMKLEGMVDTKHFIDSITVIFTALNFQVNLFPIHSNQIDKSVRGSVKTIGTSMILVPAIYILVSSVSIIRFGSQLKESVLTNIGRKYPYKSFIFDT